MDETKLKGRGEFAGESLGYINEAEVVMKEEFMSCFVEEKKIRSRLM